MKKLLVVVLVLCIAFALASCGEEGGMGTDAPEFEVGVVDFNADELPRFRIAFGYADWESALGMQHMASFNYLAEAFNFEPVFYNPGTGEATIAAVESVLAGGDIDGMISISWNVASMVIADRHGVPVVTANQFPAAAEIEAIAAFDMFLGGVVDDEVWAGYNSMRALYNAGARNVTWSGLTAGLGQGHDDRARGALQFIAENPVMNLLTESYSMGLWAQDVVTFAAVFPEVEGMGFTAVLDSVYHAMEMEGIADGSVVIAGPDVSARTGEMFERGVQVWSAGGQHGTLQIAFAILYNYLIDGTRVIPNATVPLERNYLEITSHADYLRFAEIVSYPPYSAQEIANLINYFNPNMTFEDFVRGGREFSLDSVFARRGN